MTTMRTSHSVILGVQEPNNEQAWRRFIDLYCPLVYRLCKKKGLDRETSENIFQEFCCQMVRRMPTFRYDPNVGRFRDWVLTVTLNLIRKHWRDRAARERRLEEYRLRESQGEFDEKPNQAWWESAEWVRQLQLAIERLRAHSSPRDMDIFERVVLQCEPCEPVAARHGIKPNTLYGIKFRMLARLREYAQELREDFE